MAVVVLLVQAGIAVALLFCLTYTVGWIAGFKERGKY